MQINAIIRALKEKTKGYYAERAVGELEYIANVDEVKGYPYAGEIREAADALWAAFEESGAIGKVECLAFEEKLLPLKDAAKSYGAKFIAHAHIDMNWMWGFAETVDTTLETLRTTLRMMKDYPELTFGQSQASIYKIVKEHEPEMLEEIKRQIARGKWEVTASTWVEADKNMSTGEAMARHLLYTREYLMDILGLGEEDFYIDYEPDTFGHSENVPEVLAGAGVKYYYHCRGLNEKHTLYKWVAPSGAELIAFRDTTWYGKDPAPSTIMWTPSFCEENHMPFTLNVFGVGDHGGGPTRRDIEKILDMATWPIFPEITFGTYKEFYEAAEKVKDTLPTVYGEMNTRFTGCYTTQSRIKAFNKYGELRLEEAEAMNALAVMATEEAKPEKLTEEWQRVLFNQFHDILPGSGVTETREYASGEAQKALAKANTLTAQSMRQIASHIDTSSLPEEVYDKFITRSEGGGVGYEVTHFGHSSAERGRGTNRVIHLFNPSDMMLNGVETVRIWDWEGDSKAVSVKNAAGEEVLASVTGRGDYFAHNFIELSFEAKVPPFGYATFALSEKEPALPTYLSPHDLKERLYEITLENEKLKATFRPEDFALVSLIDKATGKEKLGAPARFRLIREDDQGMEAWSIGKYTGAIYPEDVRFVSANETDPLIKSFTYTAKINGKNSLRCKVMLKKGSNKLDFALDCDWLEPSDSAFLPQFNFALPLAEEAASYKAAIPFGILERKPIDQDQPALNFFAAKASHPLFIYAPAKYGFRGNGKELAVTLIRSGGNPDRFPELGEHHIEFSLGVAPGYENLILAKTRECADRRPIYLSGSVHKGELPLSGSVISKTRNGVIVTCLKPAESGEGILLRFYDVSGGGKAEFTFATPIREAWLTDVHEKPYARAVFCGSTVTVPVEKNRIVNLLIK